MAFLDVGKSFHCLGEFGNGLIGIAVLDAVADAMAYMSFQNNLACPVQGRLGGVNLREDVLAGNILVYHAVYSLDLSYDFVEAAVQVSLIHALFHLFLCEYPCGPGRMNFAPSVKKISCRLAKIMGRNLKSPGAPNGYQLFLLQKK